MDTSSSRVKLSCCEHYGNVLNEYSDNELKAVSLQQAHNNFYNDDNFVMPSIAYRIYRVLVHTCIVR